MHIMHIIIMHIMLTLHCFDDNLMHAAPNCINCINPRHAIYSDQAVCHRAMNDLQVSRGY